MLNAGTEEDAGAAKLPKRLLEVTAPDEGRFCGAGAAVGPTSGVCED